MKTKKIRIAVAVDPKTLEWNSCGWGRPNGADIVRDSELMGSAVEFLNNGEQRFFIEAELQIEEAPAIIGKVSKS